MNDLFSHAGQSAALNFGEMFIAGLRDSLRSGGLTGIVIFLVFLFWISWEEDLYLKAGFRFMMGIGAGVMAQLFGMWDGILGLKAYDVFLDMFYFLGALSAFILGCAFFRDWMVTARDGTPARALIHFPFLQKFKPEKINQGIKTSILKRMRKSKILALSFFMGIFAELVMAAWAPDQYTSVIVYEMHKKVHGAILGSLVYALALIWPLFVIWIGGLRILQSKKIQELFFRQLTVVQIVCASIFMAYGTAIIYRYYYLVARDL